MLEFIIGFCLGEAFVFAVFLLRGIKDEEK